jgi:ABC-2 type transport system ATP-binding protein
VTDGRPTAIRTEGLRKAFGSVRALDEVDLRVAPGEVHGFLGPNGAGKSTTIRVLLGLLRRDGGEVDVLGHDPWSDAVALHRRLAYVPGEVNVWPNLSGGETIDLFGRLRGGFDRRRRDELCERFELDPSKKVRAYSKGNRQKVAIVAALSCNVELLLLDEPTGGLDPLMEAVFEQCMAEETARGHTVLLSSHILAQVEKLCHRVSIIRKGRIVESGTLDELRHLTRTTIVAVTTRPAIGFDAMPGVADVRVSDGSVSLEVDTAHLDAVVGRLHEAGIRSLVAHPPTLEELFLRHYGDEVDAGPDGLRRS